VEMEELEMIEEMEVMDELEEKEGRANGPRLRACHPMDGRALGADHRHQPDGSGVPVYQA
jgi:hypothetical protein